MIRKNVELLEPRYLSAWRKISLGTWKPIGDSQVYCELQVDAESVLKKIDELNKVSLHKITITHLMGKVMGKVLKEVPDLNAVVRLGKIYPRKNVDVFFQVSHDSTELSGHVVRNIDSKSLQEISRELSGTAKEIRAGNDANFKKMKNSWKLIPGWLAWLVLDVIGFISYSLNLNIKGLGVPRDTFGSMMITNVGSLGFSSAFVPLLPYTYGTFILAMGRAEYRPYCEEDGTVKSRKQLSLCFTFDHRVMDGAQGAKMVKVLKRYFENPELLEN
ncbi:MAG TPA: 2-oxo acid dehydrogenase subunit E2 [Bacteriovoracaceae bacterium]|nr:2-oxo acid dehydrogenase subunit E2 [Bacteriovoracaceae bacterium]